MRATMLLLIAAATLAAASTPTSAHGRSFFHNFRANNKGDESRSERVFVAPESDPDFPWYNVSLPRAQRISLLIAAMTTAEKIGQLGSVAPGIPRLAVPSYEYWSESTHGVAWAGRATVFPASIGLGATFDTELLHRVGLIIAVEGRAKHADRVKTTGTSDKFYGLSFFDPNINIFRDPRWGRGQETFGEDPFLTGELAVALITGMQNATNSTTYVSVAAAAKHFAAYNLESNFADGGTDGQYRLRFDANVSRADLVQTYLPAFRAAIERANVRSIMCSYNAVNGYPMCASPLLQSVLRDTFNFSGFIVSDCGAVGFMVSEHQWVPTVAQAAARAIGAGVDLCCGDEYSQLSVALAQKLVTTQAIDQALTRVLGARFELGMFDPVSRVPLANLTLASVDTKASRAVALEAAQKSIVLLRNQGRFLPFAPKSIAVVGPLANRTAAMLSNYPGCSPLTDSDFLVDPSCTLVNPLQGIRARASRAGASVTYAQGCDINTNSTALFDEAIAAARSADVVVAVMGIITCQETGDQCIEAEAFDRVNITLPGKQLALLQALKEANPNIVLVYINGGPISEPWAARNIPAIVELWYPGEEGGTALASVLFGDYNPSGRLPITLVESLAQLPEYLDMHMALPPGRTHRYLTATPMYTFGFGLSYSTWSYQNLRVTPAQARADTVLQIAIEAVHRSGPAALETVQVYVTLLNPPAGPNVSVPVQELKAFTRVTLSPGTTTPISLSLPVASLALVNSAGQLTVLAGQYRIWVGGAGPQWRTPYTDGARVGEPLSATISVAA